MKDLFLNRHIGISLEEEQEMLEKIGVQSMEELIAQTIPSDILIDEPLNLPEEMSEHQYLKHIHGLSTKNKQFTSYIGQGWYNTIMPAVIQRNIYENPSWYTSYTPYQAEISQGRLEALLNFQTAVCELTGMEIANASLLDEATAAAEAASMMYNLRSRDQLKANVNKLFVDKNVFPQTLAVLKTRTQVQGIQMIIDDYENIQLTEEYFGAIVQFPNVNGEICNYKDFAIQLQNQGIKLAVAADIMSLTLLTPPGEWGADIVFGTTQRWGIPMNFGGPSAGYFASKETYKREMPGRIIGVSKDAYGKTALRMALQTREQHIRRERATSNICTAQALLATMAGMYVVYHGKKGIQHIATRIHSIANYINELLPVYGYSQANNNFFDTLQISLPENIKLKDFQSIALENEVNFHYFNDGDIGLSIDETTDIQSINTLTSIFAEAANNTAVYVHEDQIKLFIAFDEKLERKSDFLHHEIFSSYRSETEMMRYIKRLERMDISLTHSMISLGSCTMKLNAASEMLPLSFPGFTNIHPLVPENQAAGYLELIKNLESYLATITGLDACSLQPNSGAAGEFAGLMTMREYFNAKNENHRTIVLIPASAHGTNPASAIQAGLDIVITKCDENGNVDLKDWREKAHQHKENLFGCMVTYPSTHGIFEEDIREICDIIHKYGGQVYMDGANMNAQVGLTNPGVIGADVCHLNLHKTFAIPHGGGGPGVGPICVGSHLEPFLPDKSFGLNTVASAPYGSAGIFPITYGYIRMLGAKGLKKQQK